MFREKQEKKQKCFKLNHFANTGVTDILSSSFDLFRKLFCHNYLEFNSTSGVTVQFVGLLVEMVTLVEVPSAVLRTVARVTAPQEVSERKIDTAQSSDNKTETTTFAHLGALERLEIRFFIKSFILFEIGTFTTPTI